MTLIRWGREGDLFSELSRMHSGLDRLFGEFDSPVGRAVRSSCKASVYPPLNIYNDGESFVVRAEVPGVDPKSINLEVTGDTLTLRGERKLPELAEGAAYHRRERDFGQFRRSLTLPERVDSSKVMASCQDGVLEIRLPQAEEARARTIAVKAN